MISLNTHTLSLTFFSLIITVPLFSLHTNKESVAQCGSQLVLDITIQFLMDEKRKTSSKSLFSRSSSTRSSTSNSSLLRSSSSSSKCNLQRSFSQKNPSSIGRKCTNLAKEQKARFYIMRRCVAMLVCWHKHGDNQLAQAEKNMSIAILHGFIVWISHVLLHLGHFLFYFQL